MECYFFVVHPKIPLSRPPLKKRTSLPSGIPLLMVRWLPGRPFVRRRACIVGPPSVSNKGAPSPLHPASVQSFARLTLYSHTEPEEA